MYYSAQKGDLEAFVRWLPKGINMKNSSSPALIAATKNGHSEMVLFLLSNGALPNYGGYVEDWPPLVYAVKYCNIEAVKALIEYGADLHFNDNMIFGNDVWKGADMLVSSIPDPSMLAYLSSIIQ